MSFQLTLKVEHRVMFIKKITPRDPFIVSYYPLVRSRLILPAQAPPPHLQPNQLDADILDIYLEYLILSRFLSANEFGILTIKAPKFIDLAYDPYINLSNIERYLHLLGFKPVLATSGVKYEQNVYPHVRSLDEYEHIVLPAIKAAWVANPPY
ncbi:hypothetical protein [Xenorhabdus eapokensis]|uniref:Uncharacterized protein n=1 Tax=Xenorhabdus eapokensis TaxID=1873482 RepID=A0A1Q5TF33_9GAMM|nr:hypothetical protein [Xenorhabdus eapokensis]OKO98812.1 hypothetical protein Xedl_03776 [Xenorhabdus eapokensis]